MDKWVKKGDVILREAGVDESAYYISSGRVQITKEKEGKQIVLAILEQGQIFGEMSLIDEKPNSATATALEDCMLEEISAATLIEMLKKSPRLIQILVSILVERIRGADQEILETGVGLVKPRIAKVVLSGASASAKEALRNESREITRFPFTVGRLTEHSGFSLSKNDLLLEDSLPLNVSRNHFSITQCHQDIFIVDRGSALGTIVNENRIGGQSGNQTLLCDRKDNMIIVGSPDSLFSFHLSIHRE